MLYVPSCDENPTSTVPPIPSAAAIPMNRAYMEVLAAELCKRLAGKSWYLEGDAIFKIVLGFL
jgi:hypothetical protein